MAVIFSLVSAPSWVQLSPAGELSFVGSPTSYIGAIVVQATNGTLTASKTINLKIKPQYVPTLDYIEVSQRSWKTRLSIPFSSIELVAPDIREWRSNISIPWSTVDLGSIGGGGSSAGQITIDGVGITIDGVPVTIDGAVVANQVTIDGTPLTIDGVPVTIDGAVVANQVTIDGTPLTIDGTPITYPP